MKFILGLLIGLAVGYNLAVTLNLRNSLIETSPETGEEQEVVG